MADELGASAEPAHLRSAVSRAYYAVYHAAVVAVENLGGMRLSSHDAVGDGFQTSVDPEVSELGQHLLDIKSSRHEADYKLARPGIVENGASVQVLSRESRALFATFADLPSGPSRAAAVSAIRTYDGRTLGR